MTARNIGFISTRFAGHDGVTLESAKWAEVLAEAGHRNFWFSGQSDRPDEVSYLAPEAFFGHEANRSIDGAVWGGRRRDPATSRAVRDLVERLKSELRAFIDRFDIDLLIPQNSNTIPMQIALGVATTEVLLETGIPAIAHHHDFHWERERFLFHCVPDYLASSFPPVVPSVRHVVINSEARDELARRCGLNATLIPNVLPFEKPPRESGPEIAAEVRRFYGLREDGRLFLQPARIVPRKGIEHAIRLLSLLGREGDELVISHRAGDEGLDYQEALLDFADNQGVCLRLLGDRVAPRESSADFAIDALWDFYRAADFVTYPSLYEGFGNAFLEAIYFGCPMLVNRYPVFMRDIEPCGFDLVTINGSVTGETARKVDRILADPGRVLAMTGHNYAVARRHFGYDVLRERLLPLVEES